MEDQSEQIQNQPGYELAPAVGPNVKWLKTQWGILKCVQLFFGLIALICGSIVVVTVVGAIGTFDYLTETTEYEHYRRFFMFTSISAFTTTSILFIAYFSGLHSKIPRPITWALVVSRVKYIFF